MAEMKELKVEDIKTEAESGRKCPVQKSLYYITGFLSGPMCGRCFPCSMGSYETRIRLQRLSEGNGTEADILAVKRIMGDMLEASMCKKGKDTAKFILEWADSAEFRAHTEGKCPAGACDAFSEYVIVSEKCTMCGLCRDACKYNAILGEKKKPYISGYLPFEIRQKRCIKCGECMKVCPEGAIIITEAECKEPVGV